MEALTRQAAAANTDVVGEGFDAAAWWDKHGDGHPLGYSSLLEALAKDPGARRARLAAFFEATDDERAQGLKVPGAAHHAIASLVLRGTVRVIVTTNFDRLIERALTDAGVPFQVVDGPGAVAGMEPLTHARCTVVKLHGDYARLDQLNTLDELSAYDPAMQGLLERILDEYGLIINGWSADWDVALVDAIKAVRSRRYPLFWTSRSPAGVQASELIARHRATAILNATADEFFPDLLSRLEALDALSAAPLSGAMAVARLKSWLVDPTARIRVHDLVMAEVDSVVDFVHELPSVPPSVDPAEIEAAHEALRQATDTLLQLVTQGIYFDRDRAHVDLWVSVMNRLLRARKQHTGSVLPAWVALEHYPALLVMVAGVAVSVAVGREDVAIRLMTEPGVALQVGSDEELTACECLRASRVLTDDWINAFPSWNNSAGWLYPPSHLLRRALAASLEPVAADSAASAVLLSRTEFRVALTQELAGKHTYPQPGEFLCSPGLEHWVTDFQEKGDHTAWESKFDHLPDGIATLRGHLERFPSW